MVEIPIYDDSNRKRIQHKLSDWGGIQNFLIGVQIYTGGFDLLILPDYLLIFSDFSENSP